MKLQLYYAPVACSLVPYLTLTEAGADFEVLPVNMGKGQHNTPAVSYTHLRAHET
jgi:glutathione S-transferase